MKNFFKTLIISIVLLNLLPAFAKNSTENLSTLNYSYEYKSIVNKITSVCQPYQVDDYIVFTASANPRQIGIVFDFENYTTIHSFLKKEITDMDGNVIKSFYFYILEAPKNVEQICYRLIIDGIWTADPVNQNRQYNPYTGIELSTIAVKNNHIDETKTTDNGVHFIYQGESGQIVRLAGTFTNWDSWIYELQETRPGYYELYLKLPEGTYYYAYYTGTKSFIDSTNPDRAWSSEGRETSKIVVN